MRLLLVLALALSSSSAFAGHREASHSRPAEPSMARARSAAVVHVVHDAPPRPGLVWIAGHYEGRRWVEGHWVAARPSVGVSVTLPMVRVDLRR